MKTKTLIIAIAAIFTTTVALANTTELKVKTAKAEVISKITKEMEYPKLAIEKNLEGDVLVAFRVDEEGKLQVDLANAEDPVLKEIVVEKLESIKAPQIGILTDEQYFMKFSFDLR